MGAVRATNIKIANQIQHQYGVESFQKIDGSYSEENTKNISSVVTSIDSNNISTYTDTKLFSTKKIAGIVGIFITIITIIFCIIKKQSEAPNVIKSPSTSLTKGYKLTSKEQTVLNILLKDEAIMFSTDGNTILKMELISSSANQIAQAYNENQVAADQRYFKKVLFISGKIQSINSGIGNKPYLSLYGTNEFLSPQAHFEGGNIEQIAALKKGQKIYLVCNGNGSIVGIPMLKNCQFAKNYAENRVSLIKAEINDFLSGNITAKTKGTAALIFLVIVETRMLPETSACFASDEKNCLLELRSLSIKKIDGEPAIAQKAPQVANELKSLGIQFRSEDFS